MEQTPSNSLTRSTADLDLPAQQFKKLVEQEIRQSWETAGEKEHLQALATSMKAMIPALLELGEEATLALSQNSPTFTPWLITYEWMEQAKSFMVLWRNVLFQGQKAWLQVSVGEVTTRQFQNLKNAAKETVNDAAAALFSDLSSENSHPLNNVKQLEKWRLQENPWPTYKEQLSQLPTQCEELLHQSETLWNACGIFTLIGSHFVETYDAWLQQIGVLKKGLVGLLGELGEQDVVDSSAITEQLEQLNEEWLQLDGMEMFHAHLDDYLLRLPQKEKIYVDTNEGLLLYKVVDLQKDTSAWLDSELVSEVYDLNTIKEGISNKISLSINHIQNRLATDKQSEEPAGKLAVEQILTNFLKSLDKSEERTQELKAKEKQKLANYFVLTKIYDEEFLPRSLQYTISQYRDSARWLEIRDWIKDKGARVSQLQRNVLAEEALSTSEKIVRIVNNRSPQLENNHYTNMFLTEGWIGDSFVVGRTAEMKRVARIVDNWKLGFRGAVMLTGKRFCGKTLFGEIIDQRFFKNQAIKLSPKSRLVLSNRRSLNTGYDLKSALAFINKQSKDQETMIWIDDLEYWQDDKITLAQNVTALLEFIDDNSSRLFFVVSMSNWLKVHLTKAFEIDRVFQSEINLDSINSNDLRNAILVRHSATHSEIIDEEGHEITVPQMTKAINRVYQQSDGNIGEALQMWAYTVEKYGDEKVMLKNKSTHLLPSFLSIDSALVLQAIMMKKKIRKKMLRKLFGPAYMDRYKALIKRMFNLRILQEEHGELEVNPYLVNEIGKLLSQKLEFKYQFNNIDTGKTKL